MKTKILFISFIIITVACSSSSNINVNKSNIGINNIDLTKTNKRSYDIIQKEKIGLKEHLGITIFDTDTTINFKTRDEIIELFGKPDSERTVVYSYKSFNILWILEGPLQNIKKYIVLMMEWEYKKDELTRVVLFIEKDGAWLSITNILYPIDLMF